MYDICAHTAEYAAKKKKAVRRVPKGTSEYQAAWIIDSDREEDDDEEEDEEEEEDIDEVCYFVSVY